ncbi:8-oxoguanine glycosylase OGG1 [Sporobolomyces koalae]|uniref:8-oxoguanine glycosylase OGG1 n=1 Tax=Sporobolomyces koalae TaxID=500713 RepID=UPI00316F9AFF
MSCLSTPLRFLPVLPKELQLATVLKSGQSFRWHRSSPVAATLPPSATPDTAEGEEWSFGCQDRTVVLRQDDHGVHYRALYPFKPPHAAYLADVAHDTTRSMLVDYFQLDTPLAPLYDTWSARDSSFKRKIESDSDGRLRGIRVLKQDEWETLVSFICSANNNIARITLMVNRLCAQLGEPLPHPSHFDPVTVHEDPSLELPSSVPPPPNDLSLYTFPQPELLTNIPRTEALLRQLGFGYRANFIPTSALHLVETSKALSISPLEYLRSLRRDQYLCEGEAGGEALKQVRDKLLEFKGVGRKVADCVLLFGLGWSQVVPIDTHVFQIAIRDYGFPASKTTALNLALHDKVSQHLAKQWQPHAGWCQQILFFADLKSTSSTTTTSSPTKKEQLTYAKVEIKEELLEEDIKPSQRRNTFEDDVREIMDNPGRKRRRTTVIKTETKIKVRQEPEVVVKTEPGIVEPVEVPLRIKEEV